MDQRLGWRAATDLRDSFRFGAGRTGRCPVHRSDDHGRLGRFLWFAARRWLGRPQVAAALAGWFSCVTNLNRASRRHRVDWTI
jgi:hypothetical protein